VLLDDGADKRGRLPGRPLPSWSSRRRLHPSRNRRSTNRMLNNDGPSATHAYGLRSPGFVHRQSTHALQELQLGQRVHVTATLALPVEQHATWINCHPENTKH
jgi:hypothetical protein